ncbi:ribonuclease P protein subunit p40-like isoform X3 [Agrilus planipennis]|nr:ribonuclease P protein subunit p40-like isoform X3 [Agrilus planipennis]
MLSPEVFNFQPPRTHVNVKKGTHTEEDSVESICNSYYNHIVSFVLPDTVKFPKELSEVLAEDTDFYKVIDIAVTELVEKVFIDKFVKKGNLTILNTGVQIDCDNCICVTPSGQLILSLIKETYQSLGIEGKLSHFSQKNKNRYIIHIDLLADSFKPGKNNYERVKSGLSKLENVTLFLNWHPSTEDVCPSSIAKYFHIKGYKVEVQKPTFRKHTLYSIKVPVFDIADADDDDIHGFTEWLGMLMLEGEINVTNNYLSTYQVPEPTIEVGQVKILEAQGLFTTQQIKGFYEALK